MIWESCVNMMLLDERVLFPSPVLGGLARIVLSRAMPDLAVRGLLWRGANNVGLSVIRNGITFDLGVSFKIDRKGSAFVTTMRRRIRCCSDGFGTMQDDRKIFLHDDPEDRIVLRASRHSYRSFWEAGLRDVWDRDKAAAARYKINQALTAGNFAETFLAVLPNKETTCLLPIQDLNRVTVPAKQLAS